MKVLLEACCGSVEEAVAAQAAGIDRIELCAGLPTGGVTPSLGMLLEARERVQVPIVFMVRSKEGRADPSEVEFRTMLRDIQLAVRHGADQIICGVLDGEERIDRPRNAEFIAAAEGRPVAFHRVFDACPDLDEALETVHELGFARILTSGGAGDVVRGLPGLTRLVHRAGDRLTILPGGGVRPHNAAKVVRETGCRELHFSFRKASGVPGYGGVPDMAPAPDRIAHIRSAMDGF